MVISMIFQQQAPPPRVGVSFVAQPRVGVPMVTIPTTGLNGIPIPPGLNANGRPES